MKIVLECTVEMVHLNRYPSTSGGQCSKLVLTGISFLDTLYSSFYMYFSAYLMNHLSLGLSFMDYCKELRFLNNIARQRPYHAEYTGSRPITEVKQRRAWSVLGWVTAWEHQVLLAF